MEKKPFENSYDLANSEPITNHYFIIQNDGTILAMDKEIQYVTQVQDDKSTMENNEAEVCTVFDASSQHYYVDVHNSTPELISINDQFVLPNVENNVYDNSYLVQTESSSTSQQVNTKQNMSSVNLHAPELQLSNVDTFNGLKQENDLTEITLSDEQYQILEQKGWILLECSDKVFVLNSLGLHDITSDDKLIHKLKSELQESDCELKPSLENPELASDIVQESSNTEHNDKVELVIASDVQNQRHTEDAREFTINETIDVEMDDQEKTNQTMADDEIANEVDNIPHNRSVEINEIIDRSNCTSIKIKTKYTFTDIPDKIFLGKTVNGKKLFAKVITKFKKNNNKIVQDKTSNNNKLNEKGPINVLHGKQIDVKPQYNGLDTSRFINLIQDSFRSSAATPQSVEAATAYILQLMRMPNMKESLLGKNLVLTKIFISKTEHGKEIGQPTMVTGRVTMQDGQYSFVHIPQMLQKLLEECDEKLKQVVDPLETKVAKDMIDLFHIHVSEIRFPLNKSPQISINLSKRKLPLDVLNDAKKRHANPLYACGSCGRLFKSENSLKDHQINQCLETEDELTIDTDDIGNGVSTFYSITDVGKEKWYTCIICEARFSRLFNCLKHITTHKTKVEEKEEVFKCKMCPSTYYHPSSLSKHIVKMHLQIPSK